MKDKIFINTDNGERRKNIIQDFTDWFTSIHCGNAVRMGLEIYSDCEREDLNIALEHYINEKIYEKELKTKEEE